MFKTERIRITQRRGELGGAQRRKRQRDALKRALHKKLTENHGSTKRE